MNSARRVEELRRKRNRREELERAELESVVGRRMIDHQAPIMSRQPGESDAQHAQRVKDELGLRRSRMALETTLLAVHFAQKCCVRSAVRVQMISDFSMWQDEYGAPGSVPTHSTSHSTATMTGEAIPRLGLKPPRWDGFYVAPNGDEIDYYRCDGKLICWDCWKPYSLHPSDPREECLTVLCNGWRVKL